MKQRILFLVLFLFACNPGPPESYSLGGFTPSQERVARESISQWCAAVNWCPTETNDGETHINMVKNFKGNTPKTRGWNDGVNIELDRAYFAKYPEDLHTVLLHELGHYCTGHQEFGIMRADQTNMAAPVVDPVAVQAWHEGCD